MSKNTPVPTNQSLADAIGVSVRRIGQLKKSGMPCESLEAAIAWRKAHENTDSAETLRLRRIALVEAQTRKIDLETARISGELISAGEVREAIVRCVSATRSEILKLANDLPPQLAGLDETRIQAVLRKSIHDTLARLADESSGIFDAPAAEPADDD